MTSANSPSRSIVAERQKHFSSMMRNVASAEHGGLLIATNLARAVLSIPATFYKQVQCSGPLQTVGSTLSRKASSVA